MNRFINLSYPFVITLLFVLGMISCERDETGDIETQGKASAKINGMDWGAEVNSRHRGDKVSIIMTHFEEIDGMMVPWEDIGISMIRKKEDSIQRIFMLDSLISTAPWLVTTVSGSFSTNQELGHVQCDYYEVIEQDSVNNWVRINQQKNDFKKVWGSFSMHLYRTSSCSSTIYPDTLLITDGQFYFVL
ncbi:hypothetical protein Oweho_0817 [Owenweeksia hongkongensis DSM 17368]|uniref:Uncharacterized protein n=2 Tax=Owenweeksia TaxID=267986 RepID=G8R280_OWEHD|nr:hypothetical protein Oweho_0817 [Owenweeksia hongkongensis DSM 17368]